jgi:hypothetical protein
LEAPSGHGVRRIVFAVAVLAAIFVLTLLAEQPPAEKPASAPAKEFSAARAMGVLNRLVGSGVPHPVGSAANETIENLIESEFRALGYTTQVQPAFDCDEYGDCGSVKNLQAILNGSEVGPAVLIAAHYDSVQAGPGAFDDAAGVAVVLEIARALKSMPPQRNPIIFLIDDGEEAGLLGAHAFVDQNLWAKSVRAVVNIDARGTSGPSLMFETGAANAWAVRLYRQSIKRPATSSIFYTAYKQIPNDTDFTVFKAAGWEGVNFAVIGGVIRYHTPLDNFENATAASVQHQGDNALESLLAFANADLSNPPPGEDVFFDVFERWTVAWPAGWTLPLALFAAVLLFFQISWMIWRKRLSLGEYLWGILEWIVMLVVTGLLAYILARLLHRLGATPVNWIAHPIPLLVTFWSLPISVVITHSMLFSRRSGFWGAWAGVWTWWTLLSVVVASLMPGVSYVVLVPSFVAALAGLPFTLRPKEKSAGSGWAATLPLALAAVLAFSPLVMLYTGLGNQFLIPIAVLVALVLTPLAPLYTSLQGAGDISRLAFPLSPVVVTGLAVFVTVVVPTYSAKAPEHANIDYWLDADAGKSQWLAFPESHRLPEPIRLATQFHRVDSGPFPWSTGSAFVADAPHVDLPPPTFTVLESSESAGKRIFRALLRSERGAPETMVMFPPGANVESVRMEGLPVAPKTERARRYFNGWDYYGCLTTPAKGIEITFQIPTGKSFELYALDRTYGLPPDGSFLLKARPLTAIPYSDGDMTVLSRRVQLIP